MLPQCVRRGIGAIGMKSLGGGNPRGRLADLPGLTGELCRRYALSQPVSSLVCGIPSLEVLRQDVAVARNFKPLSESQVDELLAKTKAEAGDGRHETFKTTQNHDGPYHQLQHGFELRTS